MIPATESEVNIDNSEPNIGNGDTNVINNSEPRPQQSRWNRWLQALRRLCKRPVQDPDALLRNLKHNKHKVEEKFEERQQEIQKLLQSTSVKIQDNKLLQKAIADAIKMNDNDLIAIRRADLPLIWVMAGPGAPIQALIDRIAQVYNFHHVIVGDILRNEIMLGTGRTEMVRQLMHRGVVIPRQFLNEIIKEDMAKAIKAKKTGFIFSDYPATFGEAKTFYYQIQMVDYVIVIKFDQKTMKFNAFHQLRRQSLSSKRLCKTKQELHQTAEDAVANYNTDLRNIYKICKNKMKVVDGHLKITQAYTVLMKWIERAMVLHDKTPPLSVDIH